jgi:RNA polymerase sigma factor (sigma-70 family)
MTAAPPGGDGELVAAVRAGRTEAYAPLYERHREAARSAARRLTRAPADADDVVADAFTRILDVISRGGGPAESFRPYLLTTVQRVAHDRARDQLTQIATDHQELPDPGELPADPVIAGLERSLITRAFESLPPPWRAVLWQTEIQQARPAQVAALLGLTPNGVSALRYRPARACARPTCGCTCRSRPARNARPRPGSSPRTCAARCPAAIRAWSTGTWPGASTAARPGPS